MNKSVFYNKLYTKIMDAMKICDEGNVIDMRLYKNDSCYSSGVYSIFDADALYEEIKDCDNWFVDFYENIKDANSAEFIDVVLWSDEFYEKEWDYGIEYGEYDYYECAQNANKTYEITYYNNISYAYISVYSLPSSFN